MGYGGDWWQRCTHVGVPPHFPNMPDASEIVMDATVIVLKAIRPVLTATIQHAEQITKLYGEELRFLLKSKQTKRFVIDISFNVTVWPQPSYLFTSLTDRSSGISLEAPPLPIGFYADAFDYNGPIKVTDIEKSLSEFVPRMRPIMSKMVKRRG